MKRYLLMVTLAAYAQIPDFTPKSPLIAALLHDDRNAAQGLLNAGANPNEGTFSGFPPLFLPVVHQNLDVVKLMLAKGADVNARDFSGSTVLMWAAANEHLRTDIVAELLKHGADRNAVNKKGETALVWASRRGETPVVELLRQSGATDVDAVRAAATKAITILQKSGPEFVKVSGCTSCHHQSLPQMAVAMARPRGIVINEDIERQQQQAVLAAYRPVQEALLTNPDRLPDPAIGVSYSLVGLAASNYPPDELTAAMAYTVAQWQTTEGNFRSLPARPPMESNDFTATAISVRALQAYGRDPQPAILRAAAWLRAAKPSNTEERAMQILGIAWTGQKGSADALLGEQRPDGGWAGLPSLETDAYSTGQALVALQVSGALKPTDAAYRRGVAYLLRTQYPDGSWRVRTRSFPVQRPKDSGFPHGPDQWISAAGTSWAAMALSLSLPLTE